MIRITHDEIRTVIDNVDTRGPETTFYTQIYNIKDPLQLEIILVPGRQLVHNICTKGCVAVVHYFINALQYSCTYRPTFTIFRKAVNKGRTSG